MEDKIRVTINKLFEESLQSKASYELKDEVTKKVIAKYHSLIAEGKSEDEAYNLAIVSIGDLSKLLQQANAHNDFHEEKKPAQVKEVRQGQNNISTGKMLILSFLLVAVCLVFAYWAKGGDMNIYFDGVQINFGPLTQAKEEKIALGSIEKINLNVNLADVVVYTSANDEIHIVESTNDKDKGDLFVATVLGNQLSIERPRNNYFGISPVHKIELTIPESFKDILMIETSSGDVELEDALELQRLVINQSSGDLEANKFLKIEDLKCSSTSGGASFYDVVETTNYNIESSSGDIKLNKLQGKGSISATSGNIEGDELSGENHVLRATSGDIMVNMISGLVQISSTSGNVEAQSLHGKNVDIKTTSGDIDINDLEGGGRVTSTSGEVELNRLDLNGELAINTTSGSVYAKTVNSNLTIKAHTSSGDIEGSVSWDYENKREKDATAEIGAGEGNMLKINTTSGEIVVDED